MGLVVVNNASSTILSAISSTDTSITVAAGDGALFPTLGGGDYTYATLQSVANVREIVKITARTDDVFTVVRGQESTIAVPFAADSRFEVRVTVANVEDQLSGIDFLLL